MSHERRCHACGAGLDAPADADPPAAGRRERCPACGADLAERPDPPASEPDPSARGPGRDSRRGTAGSAPAGRGDRILVFDPDAEDAWRQSSRQQRSERTVEIRQYPTVALGLDLRTKAPADPLPADTVDVTESGTPRPVRSLRALDPALDIVFLFDDTASMGDEIAAMQAGVCDLTERIEAGADARYGLVTFKDTPEVRLRPAADPAALSAAVESLAAGGGGDLPEDSLGAVEAALDLDLRPDARRAFVVVTDGPAHFRGAGVDHPYLRRDEPTGDSAYRLPEVAADLAAADVRLVSVAPDLDDPSCSLKTLAAETGGTWVDIDGGAFDDLLDDVAGLLAPIYEVSYRSGLRPGEVAEVGVSVSVDGRLLEDTIRVEVPIDADLDGPDTSTEPPSDGAATAGRPSAPSRSTGGVESGLRAVRASGPGTEWRLPVGGSVSGSVAFCHDCGADLRAHASPAYCSVCGVAVRDPDDAAFCPRCGTGVAAYDGPEFCPHCGAGIG